jgi:hypothetical protein
MCLASRSALRLLSELDRLPVGLGLILDTGRHLIEEGGPGIDQHHADVLALSPVGACVPSVRKVPELRDRFPDGRFMSSETRSGRLN